MASCLAPKLDGAGRGVFAGGGTMGINSERLAGTTRVCDRAFCNSACAFLALASRALGRIARGCGLMSELRGKFCNGRRFRRGNKGLAKTLAIKTATSAVMITPNAR